MTKHASRTAPGRQAPRRSKISAGSKISYPGIGPGRVTEIIDTNAGEGVAVIDIPHSQMVVQIPLENNDLIERLRPLVGRTQAMDLQNLRNIPGPAISLPGSWAGRKRVVEAVIASNDAFAWARLLRAFARFVKNADGFTASDHSALHKTMDLLAAELSIVLGLTMQEASACVRVSFVRLSGREPRPHRTRMGVIDVDDTD